MLILVLPHLWFLDRIFHSYNPKILVSSINMRKFPFTKNMKITNPLAKLVKLFTATVIIASLQKDFFTFRGSIQGLIPTDRHCDENHCNLQMPSIHQNPVPMKKMSEKPHRPKPMHRLIYSNQVEYNMQFLSSNPWEKILETLKSSGQHTETKR